MAANGRIYLVTSQGVNSFISAFDYSATTSSIDAIYYKKYGSGGTPVVATSVYITASFDSIYFGGRLGNKISIFKSATSNGEISFALSA
jgi:hypothetical protein